tara:strand:+ start:452 stop:652 length:201 start_codon:yes stop_codon:yes gene_type:complete
MSKEEDKKLVSKFLKEANEIHKNRKPKANFLVLTDKQIQDMADTQGITFDEMSRDIEEHLNQKKDE